MQAAADEKPDEANVEIIRLIDELRKSKRTFSSRIRTFSSRTSSIKHRSGTRLPKG